MVYLSEPSHLHNNGNARLKILCLHGSHANADVLRFQLQTLIPLLSTRFEFVFFEGSVNCNTSTKEILAFFEPPFHEWFPAVRTGRDVRNALLFLTRFIATHGPFVGAIGFSQGAEMLHLAQLAACYDRAPPLSLAFVVSMAGVVPFSAGMLPLVDLVCKSRETNTACDEQATLPILATRSMHVIGRKDVHFFASSVAARDLYDRSRAAVLWHEGGHSVPLEIAFNQQLAEFIENAVEEHSKVVSVDNVVTV
ncbi:serine hydrolase FSH [Powellomyces hirtus]|nr:serine hydrolase FSH [Powellomyces hirtus]